MNASAVGAIVFGGLLVLIATLLFFSTLEILGNPGGNCQSPTNPEEPPPPLTCSEAVIVGAVIEVILLVVGLLLVHWGWIVAERPFEPDT